MKRYKGRRELGSAALVVLLVVYTGIVQGAEVPGEPTVPPQVQEEEIPRPPEKPPEKPIELEQLLPSIISPTAPTTFEVGPSMGVLAPYGYSAAQDTLARGWQRHHLGPVGVSPYFEYIGIYRTNIFQTPNNKQADFVNAINPGLRLELPVAQTHKLSMAYLGNYFIYSRLSNNSHYDHNFNADAAFNFSKFGLRVGNTFRAATEERTAENAQKRRYTRESPYLAASYKFADRWKMETNYQFDALTFVKQVNQNSDYQYHTLGWSLNYKFWPKTAALLQYVLLFREHPNAHFQDNTTHTPLVGLTWDPTAKLSGTVKFGYTFEEFQNPIPGRNTNPNSWALNIQTLYRISRYSNLTLIAQRSIQEDTDFNNNSYINSGLFLTASHFFHYFQINSYVAFSFYNNAYQFVSFDLGQLKKRNDNITSAGAGLSRPMNKWLTLRLDYTYNNKGSNFSNFSYNEHKIMFGAQTSF